MGTLRNEQIGNASGLFNLLRNVGGGVGISVVNTLVARHQQIHRAELAGNIATGNPAFSTCIRQLAGQWPNWQGRISLHEELMELSKAL